MYESELRQNKSVLFVGIKVVKSPFFSETAMEKKKELDREREELIKNKQFREWQDPHSGAKRIQHLPAISKSSSNRVNSVPHSNHFAQDHGRRELPFVAPLASKQYSVYQHSNFSPSKRLAALHRPTPVSNQQNHNRSFNAPQQSQQQLPSLWTHHQPQAAWNSQPSASHNGNNRPQNNQNNWDSSPANEPKREVFPDVSDRITAPSYMYFTYSIVFGNNSEMVERVLSNRSWWKSFAGASANANWGSNRQSELTRSPQFYWKQFPEDSLYGLVKEASTLTHFKKAINRIPRSFELCPLDFFFPDERVPVRERPADLLQVFYFGGEELSFGRGAGQPELLRPAHPTAGH